MKGWFTLKTLSICPGCPTLAGLVGCTSPVPVCPIEEHCESIQRHWTGRTAAWAKRILQDLRLRCYEHFGNCFLAIPVFASTGWYISLATIFKMTFLVDFHVGLFWKKRFFWIRLNTHVEPQTNIPSIYIDKWLSKMTGQNKRLMISWLWKHVLQCVFIEEKDPQLSQFPPIGDTDYSALGYFSSRNLVLLFRKKP